MSRIQIVRENWARITSEFRTNPSKLKDFLKFSSQMYKERFSDAALIYQQSPNATKIAEVKKWNHLGRFVKRGQKGFAVFLDQYKCKYMFDVTQTQGKALPKLWKLDKGLSKEVVKGINKRYQTSCVNITEAIEIVAVDNIQDRMSEINSQMTNLGLNTEQSKIYQKSLLSAVKYVTACRCELNSDLEISDDVNFDVLNLFRDNNDLINFFDLVQKSAKGTILEFEKDILKLTDKQKVAELAKKQDEQTQEETSVGESKADEIRNANTVKKEIADSGGGVVSKTETSEPIILNNEPVLTQDKLPPMLDEELIKGVILHDDFFMVGKNEIADCFKKTQDFEKRTEYIKDKFNKQSNQFLIDDEIVGYNASDDNLFMWQGEYSSRSNISRFNWNFISSMVADMIDSGEYDKSQQEKFEPVFDEKKKRKKAVEPLDEVQQLSFLEDTSLSDELQSKILLQALRLDAENVSKHSIQAFFEKNNRKKVLVPFTKNQYHNKYAKTNIAEYPCLVGFVGKKDGIFLKYAYSDDKFDTVIVDWETTARAIRTLINNNEYIQADNIELTEQTDTSHLLESKNSSLKQNDISTETIKAWHDLGDAYVEAYEETHGNSTTKLSENISHKGNSISDISSKTGKSVMYEYTEAETEKSGPKARFFANYEAIQTLKKIETENRFATSEEQQIMSQYVGWGGIPQAFDEKISNWNDECQKLKSLLSDDEYKAARASTLTSFYTPPEVVDGVYQALSQFGFSGGNILEPSMGVGNFFAKMPTQIRDNSKLYGVELDSISGRISGQLYPNANIQVKGFEQTSFNNNSFDVVLGNIPFGDYRVSDKAYDKYKFKIHDYFAAKSVDKVKPGGVVILVTSKFTMDKQNEKARRYLAERCDLLGAVRLPSGTFRDADSVTTDILFFKKRDTLTIEVPDWVHMSQTADGIPCNQYFVDNPDMVLGKMAWDERMKGKYGDDSKITTCVADVSTPFEEQLKTAISKISGSINTVEEIKTDSSQEYVPADPSVRNFTHTIVDGNLYFRENEIMTKVSQTGKTLDRMMGMHKVRQSAMKLIDAQAEDCSDEQLAVYQLELNTVYDKFQKAYGYISDSANERCFRQDDDYNTIASFEVVDKEKETVKKADIFSKRTIKPELEITSVDTSQEALQVSIDRIGRVDIQYMAKLTGLDCEEIVSQLSNDIFRNPAKINKDDPLSGYEDSSEYLSGNVREKLKIAKEYAEHIDKSFENNVKALEEVIPKDLEAGEISVRIGANWIDVQDYNSFLKDYAKAYTDKYGHPVARTRLGEYKIEGKYQDKSVAANETYGTSRMSSYHIFENLLNQRDIVVRDRRELDGKVWYEVNPKETQLAKEKARKMKEAFKSWVWEDIGRREKYVKRYNEMFNAIRGREYDGSHQAFPGMSPSIKLKPHQENAVLRGKLGGNTLLAHCVGAGKSFEMVATTMEKRRLGLINKACIVVPKHLTLQTASEWMRLYPNAKLLVARPEDFTKDNRQKFIGRCVTGEYDAVIMSFTQFERIPMSDEFREQFINRELNEVLDAINDTDKSDRVSIKALERAKMKFEEKLEKLTSSKKDNSLCFEKLGFDYLVCDEAHNYKNCFVTSKMSNVAGVQTTAAQKSEDMLMKTQYLNDKFSCNNILFATGTPINTL